MNVDARPRRRRAGVPPRHQRDAAVGGVVLVRAALLRPDQRRGVRRPGGRALLDGAAHRRAPRSSRRCRPVRRWRRARRAPPALRPLLAQGALRPRLPVVVGALRPAVQPGLRARCRVRGRARDLRATPTSVVDHDDGTFTFEGRPGHRGTGARWARASRTPSSPERDLRRLRRRHAAAAPDGHRPARRLAPVGDRATSSACSASCNGCGATSSTSTPASVPSSTTPGRRRHGAAAAPHDRRRAHRHGGAALQHGHRQADRAQQPRHQARRAHRARSPRRSC